MTAGEFWSHPLTVTVCSIFIAGAFSGVVVAVRVMFQVKGILVGPDGQNGLRSEVRRLLATVDVIGDDVSDLQHRISRVEEDHGREPPPIHGQYDRRHAIRGRVSNG